MVYSYQNVAAPLQLPVCTIMAAIRSSGSDEIISAVHADRIDIADVAILNSDRMGKNRY